MCDFVSWIKITKKGETSYLYLTNKEVESSKGKELRAQNGGYNRDMVGHGAIREFFGISESKGKTFEVSDFTKANQTQHLPAEIITAIKKKAFSRVPGAKNKSLLTGKAKTKFVAAERRFNNYYPFDDFSGTKRNKRSAKLDAMFWELFSVKANRAKGW